jgi:hypothetical protein
LPWPPSWLRSFSCAFGAIPATVFFLFFAIAFFVDALDRVALGLTAGSAEHEPFFYGVRLLTYGLIIAAIVDKNRPRGARGTKARASSLTVREKP